MKTVLAVFGWDRWWTRLLVTYSVSALAFLIAINTEIQLVRLGLVDVWLDTPMFLDLPSMFMAAAAFPVIMLPFFLLAEVAKQLMRKPLPRGIYIAFTGIFSATAMANYDFGHLIFGALDKMENEGLRIAIVMAVHVAFAAGLTFALYTIRRKFKPSQAS